MDKSDTVRANSQSPTPTLVLKSANGTSSLIKHPSRDIEVEFPDDGLRAWLIAFGGACNIFSTFGYITAWGVFQSYYQDNTLRDQSPSEISWIGSTQYSLIFFPGLFAGRLFDLGHFRLPLFIASVIIVMATFLTAECTKFWHFLLCQGVAVGFGSGLIVGPSISITSHWFRKRKGAALGFQAIGSALGGVVFPIMIRNLIPRIGFKWALRVTGFVLMLSTGCSNLTMRRRFPATKGLGGLCNFQAFRDRPEYLSYCISTVFAFLGLWTVLIYIDVSGKLTDISLTFSFYLVAITNGAGGLGRYVGGIISDKLGAINTMIPFSFVAAIVTYVWPFSKVEVELISVAVVYGFCSGVYVAVLPAPVFAMGPVEETGGRLGTLMTMLAPGALAGPPISGAIYARTGRFAEVGCFAGTCIIVSCAFMLLTKRLALGPSWLTGKY